MLNGKRSSSPKLVKAKSRGSEEMLHDDARAKCRSAVLALPHLSNERSGITSAVRLRCSRWKSPGQTYERQLKKPLRYVQDTKYTGAEFMPREVQRNGGFEAVGGRGVR